MKKIVSNVCIAAALVLPVTPAHAADPIVRTEECPPGMVGRTVYIGDNAAARTCYRLP